MTYASERPPCPSAETLAEFVAGRLKGAAAAAVVEHLDGCDECAHDVALGMNAEEEEHELRPRRWTPWLLAVAASLIAVLMIPVLRDMLHRSPVDRLVALAPKNIRVVEPRLTGGFAWASYAGAARSTIPQTDAASLKLGGAVGELVERAQHDKSAEAQHGAGVAMLLVHNPVEAMDRLQTAARTQPSAQTWSDLAAARYAAASDLGRAALYPQALAAADAALRLDADLAEALFNRALILERMGLIEEARRAWTRYLAVDPSSKWAGEAREHLAELPAKASSTFERDRPLLESAATRGDAAAVRMLVQGNVARARAFAEAEYLGRWGEAVLENDEAGASRWLNIARGIGAAVAQESGDTLLRDAVQAIDAAPKRETLGAAHAAYRAGRIAYSKQEIEKALTELGRAASGFADARSPMALVARYYIAGAHQAKSAGAGAELERILSDVEANGGYLSLRAHVGWELGRARMFDDDYSGAAAILSGSAAAFRRTGDRMSEAFVQSMLAYCLAAVGRGDEAWSSHVVALRALSEEGNTARLLNVIGGVIRGELQAGRTDAALALSRLAQPDARDGAQLSLALDALVYQSMLEAVTGNAADALRTARQAGTLVQGVVDPAVRARRSADIDVVMGAALHLSDPAGAAVPLTRAIDFYRGSALPFALPEPLLLRARCALRTGNADAAERDLEEGMQIVERHRARSGMGILDADHALFTDAIRSSLDRGHDTAAFTLAERSRGAKTSVAELQRQLAGSATALLEIVALPEEVVTFAVTENEFEVARRPRERATLTALADVSLSEDGTAAAAAIYDDIIRPLDAIVSRAGAIIIVPDRRMERVPFAALIDAATHRYLVERVSVAIASSAASLQREEGADATSVAVMVLPAGAATGMAALPQGEREIAEIAALYRRSVTIPAGRATFSALRDVMSTADVVHITGHTERQLSGGEYALLLTGSDGASLERVSSKTLAATTLPHVRVVVLAACETLRPPASSETQALSLGGAFAAAGAADVIGTLTPIGDRDARTFFRELHRQLSAGGNAADALRAAQLNAIRERKESGAAWRSIALLTNRVRITNRREPS